MQKADGIDVLNDVETFLYDFVKLFPHHILIFVVRKRFLFIINHTYPL